MKLKQIALMPVVAILVCFIVATNTFGDVTVTASETNGNVLFTGSGTLDLTSGTYQFTTDTSASVFPIAFFVVGPDTPGPFDVYGAFANFSGPSSIGFGLDQIFATDGLGDLFGVDFIGGLGVPEGYISGSPLSGTSTYAGQTFATMGLSPGVYTWTWGTGSNSDSFTLNIVPEPSSTALLGICLIGAWVRRRRS